MYLDETWLNEGYSRERSWEDSVSLQNPFAAKKSGLTAGTIFKPHNQGRRLMIVHAGSEEGFLPLDLGKCVYEGKVNIDGDYHKNMNFSVFESWFHHLLDNLTVPSVIIMDNASYHYRKTEAYPTSKWTKAQYQSWLSNKGISWENKMLKVELWQLVKQHRLNHKTYVCDEMASARGHIVMRLPPYHSDLNPIELIWAQVKDLVGKNKTIHTLKEAQKKLHEAFKAVTAERWRNCCRHVVDIEKKYWETDLAMDLSSSDLAFTVDSDSENDSENDCDDRREALQSSSSNADSDEDIIDFSSL